MSVADLIAELKQFPQHLPVKVVLSEVIHFGELGEWSEKLCDDDAIAAYEVRNMGGHVLIRSE